MPVSLFSMVWLALAPGCAMDGEEGLEDELAVGAQDEATDEAPSESSEEAIDIEANVPVEKEVAIKDDRTKARENGDWCHAKCSFADIVYAGPNVTRNCHDWGHIVCHNRSSELVNAYWCAPLQCRIDAILQ